MRPKSTRLPPLMRSLRAGSPLLSFLAALACTDVVAPPPGRYVVTVSDSALVSWTVDETSPFAENLVVRTRYYVELRNLDRAPLRLMGCRPEPGRAVVLHSGGMRVGYATDARARDGYRAHCDDPAVFSVPAGAAVRLDVDIQTGGYSFERWNENHVGDWRWWFLTPNGVIWSPPFRVGPIG